MPGTSEHELGLAVDLVDGNNYSLDESQESTPAQKWLMENCWDYGWILRYPNDKTEVTGIIYEPWHYRYVGGEHAKAIYESGLCLEEWLEQRNTLLTVKNAIRAQAEALRGKTIALQWYKP